MYTHTDLFKLIQNDPHKPNCKIINLQSKVTSTKNTNEKQVKQNKANDDTKAQARTYHNWLSGSGVVVQTHSNGNHRLKTRKPRTRKRELKQTTTQEKQTRRSEAEQSEAKRDKRNAKTQTTPHTILSHLPTRPGGNETRGGKRQRKKNTRSQQRNAESATIKQRHRHTKTLEHEIRKRKTINLLIHLGLRQMSRPGWAHQSCPGRRCRSLKSLSAAIWRLHGAPFEFWRRLIAFLNPTPESHAAMHELLPAASLSPPPTLPSDFACSARSSDASFNTR